jgi:diguanylate cyclase (GGDEF)-like protein/PAS domain S-box-containing protein
VPRIALSLTDSRIRQTQPSSKTIKLSDGGGMYLLVRPDGSRYWRLDYRFGGKRKTLALGVYPQVSLDEARKRRHAAKALLAEGQDPSAVRKASKNGNKVLAGTVGQVLADAFTLMGEGVWCWDLRSGEVSHNAQWARLMGLDEHQLEHPWEEVLTSLHEADRRSVMAAIQDCLDGKDVLDSEYRVQRADGSIVWVQNRAAVAERDADGKALRMLGYLRELPEERRMELVMRRRNLLLEIISTVNQMLVSDLSDQELMAHVCQEMVRDSLFRMVWIGLVAEDGVTVHQAASAGFDEGYLAEVDIRCDDSPQGQGPTGTAIREGKTQINNDTETDPRFALWRERARAHGYRSSAATPLCVHGRIIGALSVYAQEPHAFGKEKVMLLEKLAADLGVAMGHRQMVASLRESEERFRLLLDSSPEAIFGIDNDGICTFVNPACLKLLGYERDEMLGKNTHALIHHTYPDGRPYPKEQCRVRCSSVKGETTHVDNEVHWRKDGTSFPVEYWSHPMYRNGEVVGAVINFIDITERRRAEEALRKSEARYRAMAEQSADWVWSMNVEGRHTYSNQRGAAILGYKVDEFLASNPAELVHPDDLPLYRDTLHKAVSAQRGWKNVVLRWRHKDGGYRIIESNASPVLDEARQLVGFQGVDRDITERRQAEERIQFLAHHDSLTGLPNRILLRDRFDLALAVAEHAKSRVAMLFLDLDNFKVVNDTLGHAAGDQMLLNVVKRLSVCTRDGDTISRQGGDEFILLLNDVPDLETVEGIAGDILTELAEPMKIDGRQLNTSCSIGIAIFPEDGTDFDSLLQKADTAMYNAKDAGRNTYRFFDEQMNALAHDHLQLQNRLHYALVQEDFHLHFQPQIDIGSGKVIGVEALLRWHDDELGDVAPSRFIPVAEDCGLIVPIGAWALVEACLQMQAWRAAGLPDMTLSVNLSAVQFRRANLISSVAGALNRSGLPPHLLELELTESILLQDAENNLDTVRQLKALGLRLSIDDFGTGYSSFSYLKRFAVDRVKIDQSFVRDISIDPDDAAIVRAIIQLARSLRLGIVAEGVETEEQFAFLRDEGCEGAQGYLISRPLPAVELEAYLGNHRK